MKDFAYFFLPFGGILVFLLIFIPTPRVHRACVYICCLHLKLGFIQIGVAACICLYSFIRLLITSLKLREVYAAAAAAAAANRPLSSTSYYNSSSNQHGQDPSAAAASAAAAAAAAAAGFPIKGSSSYQLRHERNLWIELFCLVLWLFLWRTSRLLNKNWQQIQKLKEEIVALKQQQNKQQSPAAAPAAAAPVPAAPIGAAASGGSGAADAAKGKLDGADREGGIEMMRLRKQHQQHQDSD